MTSRTYARHRAVALACVVFVAAMVGAAYAAVPLYAMFCQLTGFGGTPVRADTAPTAVSDREFLIRFDANVGAGLPWRFEPPAPIRVKAGEVKELSYTIANESRTETVGIASYNVSPPQIAAYFNKLQCFCFTDQKLAPGETREVTVQFFVDPEIDKDEEGDGTDTITLSYTFFPARQPSKPVAGVTPADAPRKF